MNFYRILEFEYYDKLPKTWLDSKPTYQDGMDGVKKTVDFRGKTMQVIVKLANIVLTPEKPEYAGGTWHVEGRCIAIHRVYSSLQLVHRHEQ